MSLIASMIVGLAAGFISSRIVNRSGVAPDFVLGVVGALIAGWLFSTLGMPSVTSVDLRYTLLVVVVGVALLLVAVVGTHLLLAMYGVKSLKNDMRLK